uniref:ADP ribosyltransferase domain-containing protein n=1 Tax=Pithovirus LCPAC101 TaxID=2506586 RepID=A0A481Z573_9VIRU|nr:MAG: hypothetical protein LCPAC101_00730 [Pithovirus LCPAC101]
MQNLINDRIKILSKFGKTDALAYVGAKSIIGDSLSTNKKYIPLHELYMYQVMDIGSIINKGLRQNRLSLFLYNIYNNMINSLSKHNCIGKNITVFRGIPNVDIQNVKIGDIISDKAFNSVSLNPGVSTFFGNILLIIHLRKNDKLMFVNGHDNLYSDIFECILPCEMKYKIISKHNFIIHNKETKCFILDSLGHTLKNKIINIDLNFDILYIKNIVQHVKLLKGNMDKPISSQIILSYKLTLNNSSDINCVKRIHEIGHFDDHHELYINIMSKKNYTHNIIKSLILYLGLFSGTISCIQTKCSSEIYSIS